MNEALRAIGQTAAVSARPDTPRPQDAAGGEARPLLPSAVTPAKEAAAPNAEQREETTEAARALLERLDAARAASRSKLRIERNEETGDFVYKSIDRETGEVIQQWPEERLLQMLSFLGGMKGLLVDRTG